MQKKRNQYTHSLILVPLVIFIFSISLVIIIPFAEPNMDLFIMAGLSSYLIAMGVYIFLLKDKLPKFLLWSYEASKKFNTPAHIDLEKEKLLIKSTIRKNTIYGMLFFLPGILLWSLMVWIIFR